MARTKPGSPGYSAPGGKPSPPNPSNAPPLSDQIDKLAAAIEGLSKIVAGMASGGVRSGRASAPAPSFTPAPRAPITPKVTPQHPASGSPPDWLTKMMARASVGATGSASGGATPGSGGRRPSGIGGLGDQAVLDRLADLIGRKSQSFDASQIAKVDGKVDWGATTARYRRSLKDDDERGGDFDPIRSFTRPRDEATQRKDATGDALVATVARILPPAIAAPVINAFEKNKGWRDLGRAFDSLARDATDAGKPFAALVGKLGGKAAAIALGVGIPVAALGVGMMAVNKGLEVGLQQSQRMSALAPFSGEMIHSYVDLEMGRLQRRFRQAENVSETGSAMMGAQGLLEHSLVGVNSVLESLKNQIGTMASGGVGLFTGMATNAVSKMFGGASAQDFDKGIAAFNERSIRVMGGDFSGAGAAGKAMGFAADGAKGLIGGLGAAIGGPLIPMIGLGDRIFGPGVDRITQEKFNDDIKFLKDNAPEMLGALQIPSLLMGIAGASGAFGQFGPDGFNQGVRKATEMAVEQAKAVEEEKAELRSAWMNAFGAIANDGAAANLNAEGPRWDIGPQQGPNAGMMGGFAVGGQRRRQAIDARMQRRIHRRR